MSIKSDVLVIGAGVIGTACAWDMARRGLRVTVIDRGAPGMGCSYGNAGWITPSLALPLPMPGVLLKGARWLTDPESPFYIQPTLSPRVIRWLLRFCLSTGRRTADASIAALVQLATHSLDAYRRMEAEHPGAFGFRQEGFLIAARSHETLDGARKELDWVGRHGVDGHLLDADELRDFEPALARGALSGGVFYPDEAYAEPLATVRHMADRAREAGAEFLDDTEMFEFDAGGGAIRSARTTRGVITAKTFVMAAGSCCGAIARRIGLRVPVLAGKGYAMIVDPVEPAPARPMLLLDRKLGITPRDGSMRIAGTLELVDQDDSITPRRVAAMLRGAAEFLDLPAEPRVIETWRGMRPCTPDGVPIIGPAPRHDNLFIATGHQMCGLLSAPATGRLIGDLVTGEEPTFDPRPFRAERF